ncbi:MAG TPA: methionyl-tRNA formyltransferase [Burkholderiales bacterium]
MRLAFAGTPEFAARALAALLGAGHEVVLVLTQPDRPAGRGMQPAASAVKRLAAKHDIEVFQPESLKPPEAVGRLRAARPDALVVAAYGLLLPQAALDIAPLGALNIHASLLPRWRGAAPIQRALLAGDRESGVSIMQMDAGLDTGPVLLQKKIIIDDDDDARTLHDKLATLGAEAIVEALVERQTGRARAVPQAAEGVTYARKIGKEETRLDWVRPAAELERAARAFLPALAALEGESLRIWRTRVIDGQGAPGELLRAGPDLVVACGAQALEILELQRPGGRRLGAAEFLRGHPLRPGMRWQ